MNDVDNYSRILIYLGFFNLWMFILELNIACNVSLTTRVNDLYIIRINISDNSVSILFYVVLLSYDGFPFK